MDALFAHHVGEMITKMTALLSGILFGVAQQGSVSFNENWDDGISGPKTNACHPWFIQVAGAVLQSRIQGDMSAMLVQCTVLSQQLALNLTDMSSLVK